MKWIKWLFSPIFEAFEIDKLVTDCNGLDITCGTLDEYTFGEVD